MNARIQELYKQATGKDWVYDFDPDYAEKFAELIVRECATWIDGQPGWDGPYGHELLNFFGVEE